MSKKIIGRMANTVDPEEQSDLGLHCLLDTFTPIFVGFEVIGMKILMTIKVNWGHC